METVDALIVGAGPSGLTLACDLARRGLSVALADENEGRISEGRTVALHSRTLELLEPMGLADGLVETGQKLSGATVWAGSDAIVGVEFSEVPSRFSQLVVLPQASLEEALESVLAASDVRVRRGHRLTGFRQDGTGVTATFRTGEGEASIRAGWLIGADGADSLVRTRLELGMEAYGAPHALIVADVSLEWDRRDDRIHVFVGEGGIVGALPNGVTPAGVQHRVFATLPPDAEGKGAAPTLDDLATLFALHANVNVRFASASWLGRLDVRPRQASAYRDDRVFLVGDAAHVQASFLGTSVNTGVQDALNLGFKLALVHRGEARARLLDSYDAERRHAGSALARGAEAALRAASAKGAIPKAMREPLGSLLVGLEAIQLRVGRDDVGLSTSYEASSIVAEDKTSLFNARLGAASGGDTPTIASIREFASAPGPGQRAPDGRASVAGQSGTKRIYEVLDAKAHALLLFDGRASTPEGFERFRTIIAAVRDKYGSVVTPWVITPRTARSEEVPEDVPVLLDPDAELEQRYAATTECAYLLRPDFYVGYRSQPADADGLLDYLARLFRKLD